MTLSRRRVLTAAAAATWAGGSAANAANPIKIGMPLALTGPLGSVGEVRVRPQGLLELHGNRRKSPVRLSPQEIPEHCAFR